jgi:hypothetical protein
MKPLDSHVERRPDPPSPDAVAQPPEQVQRMHGAFDAALGQRAARIREETYTFAGRPVRLRVVGSGLAARTHRAFGHLAAACGTGVRPALRIDLWDERETGVPCPLALDAMDLQRQWVAAGGALTASPDGRYVSFRYQESIMILDRTTQRMIGCRRDGSRLSGGEYSKPFIVLLSIWYHDRGVQILHAGLLARGGAGVLIPGESGTGKSTTCVAGFAQGLEYLGDDFVGLEHAADGAFQGHSVFNTACLARKDVHRFPDIRPFAVDDGRPEEEKPILFLSEIHADRFQASVPVRAVVLLRVRQERTEVRPARRGEALRAFAASTLHTVVPRPGREALHRLGALVERVPAYWLLLGPDLSDVSPSIDRVLRLAASRDVA